MADLRYGSTEEFVLEVAALIQAADQGEVRVSAGLDGLELDIVIQRGQRRGKYVTVVECKAYTKLVGSGTVRSFASMFEYLRDVGEANEGWLVTLSGFTTNARAQAEQHNIKLFTLGELREHLGQGPEADRGRVDALRVATQARTRGQRRVFAIMPFKPEFDDVYILGIRWAAAKLKVTAQRADDFKHMGDIVTEIKRAIEQYDAVVGDTTGANPNVCYEVGFAHALGRPTVLVCRAGNELPFDLQGVNHILYPSVVELRPKLLTLLKTALGI